MTNKIVDYTIRHRANKPIITEYYPKWDGRNYWWLTTDNQNVSLISHLGNMFMRDGWYIDELGNMTNFLCPVTIAPWAKTK